MKLTRRAALGGLAAASILPAHAQGNALRIVVPFGPGGSTDAVARLVSPGLMQPLGCLSSWKTVLAQRGLSGRMRWPRRGLMGRRGC
jgi:tripartite-type tricarboxylate transporter receptor subunit TctC